MAGAVVERSVLKELRSGVAALKKGASKNILLLGCRKVGKTTLLEQHVDFVQQQKGIAFYLDLAKISLSPENFSLDFIASLLSQFFGKQWRAGDLFSHASSLNNTAVDDALSVIKNELEKIKPDQRLILTTAFNLLPSLSQERKVVVCWDNVEHLLALNNFSQIKDVFSLIDFKNNNIQFVVTSSAVFLMKKILPDFEITDLERFNLEETKELVALLSPKSNADEIFDQSHGHPYIIKNLCHRNGAVSTALAAELTESDAPSSVFFESLLNDLLHTARGASLLKTIVHELCFEDNVRLTEIARRIYRSAPVTKSLLERLIEVDLIERKKNRYVFADPLLKVWLKLSLLGVDAKKAEALLNE